MQIKNLFSFGNIRNVLIVGLIVFLTLPLLVPEDKPFSVLKKENIMDRDESPLPIFPQENLVQEYTTRLKRLYRFNKTLPLYKTQQEIEEEIKNGKIYAKADLDLIGGNSAEDSVSAAAAADADNRYEENEGFQEEYENIPANERAARRVHNTNEREQTTDNGKKQDFGEYLGDLFFAEDYLGEEVSAPKSQAFVDDTVNLQRGTVATIDNIILEPTQEGYYYQGTFYKNGTYPPNVNKNSIEKALKKYHVKVAKNLGKKALYFADKNGNLVVGYVKKLPSNVDSDIEIYKANNPVKTNENRSAINDTLYASSKNYGKNNKNYNKFYDRYRGARINSQNTSNNPNAMYADIAAASLQDMHAAYNMAIGKINSGEIGQGIDIPVNPSEQEPVQNIAKQYLDTLPPAHQAQQPEDVPSYSGNQDDVLNIPVGKEKDFVEEFTEQISSLNCIDAAAMSAPAPASSGNTINMDMFNQLQTPTDACSAAPISLSQLPENMCESLVFNISSGNQQSQQLTLAIAHKISSSDKNFAEIISTQQNFPTLLSAQPQFTNKNGEDVTLSHIAFGPKTYQDPKDTKLSSYYESIINTVATNQDEANQLKESIDNFYDGVKDNLNKPTIFISAINHDTRKVFVENNPRTGYIGPLPQNLKGKEMMDFVMINDSVIHTGEWVPFSEFMGMIDEGNINMYIVSDQSTGEESSCTDNQTCFQSIKGEKAFSTQLQDISENITGQIKLTEKGTKVDKKEGKKNAEKLRRNFGAKPAKKTK